MSQLELPMPISGLPLDLRSLAAEIHADNIAAGWWKQLDGRTMSRNVGELLALVHSEISEADEGYIGALQDDKLPHRSMVEVELADTAIRVLDMLGFYRSELGLGELPLHSDIPLPKGNEWQDWCSLMHRTTTKALEGFRKGNAVVGCQHLIDLLGVIHFCAIIFQFDLSGAIAEKRAFNAQRLDHKLEVRAAAGGKAF